MSEEHGMNAAPNLPLGPLTLKDVTALAAADDQHRFELAEGNLIVMPPATWRHQEISLLMGAWLLARGFRGRVSVAPGVKTADDNRNGRIPDLAVTKAAAPPDEIWLEAASVLLAVEIVSPGAERTDRWFKPIEYAEAGIEHFWRVEPDDTVLRFQLVDGAYKEIGREPLDTLLDGEVPDLD
ncbi:Uma2 family endonuclease [Dactylosporangium sp. NPDC049742]|uniref:Uma2 family endonuclease n=1 Tax=Dactylosporangium sp. NPDC049742 TaxID=3154737 RepID=UPI003437FBFD